MKFLMSRSVHKFDFKINSLSRQAKTKQKLQKVRRSNSEFLKLIQVVFVEEEILANLFQKPKFALVFFNTVGKGSTTG